MSRVVFAGRRREMAEVGRVLDGAADGRGCVLAIAGPPGSGRTELAAAAAREGARRGFTVLRTAAMHGEPGALAWARLLADAGAPDELASRVLGDAGPLALDTAARALTGGNRRLLVIDDIDHGGAAALRLLETVAARAAAADTAVVVTSVLPLGVGTQLRLTGLSEDELAAVLPGLAPRDRRAVWLASAGLPGSDITALDLAADGPGLAAADAGPLLDDTARDAYRHRIRRLDSELAAADRTGTAPPQGEFMTNAKHWPVSCAEPPGSPGARAARPPTPNVPG